MSARRLATSDDFAMSGDFDSLNAREKAALEAALKRCCVLADRIESILRIERRDFVDKVSLADFCASLERAADVLRRKSRSGSDNYGKPSSRPPKKRSPDLIRGCARLRATAAR